MFDLRKPRAVLRKSDKNLVLLIELSLHATLASQFPTVLHIVVDVSVPVRKAYRNKRR